MPDTKNLKIINASENNLKSVSLDIPHDAFSVVTGLSGSGKSSLAFDTVYAEGQRRYIETFSPYTRQFFDKVKKPHVDAIINVRPAVAIQQRTRITSARSTVGSLTNIMDYLKVLWSNIAVPVCPSCEITLESWKPETLAARLEKLIALKDDARFLICAVVVFESKSLKGELLRLSTLGFSRVYRESDGATLELEECGVKDLSGEERLIVILDRFVGGKSPGVVRLRDTIEQAFSLSSGSCILVQQKREPRAARPFLTVYNNELHLNVRAHRDLLTEYRNTFSCPVQDIKIERPTPALFSYNHPLGACPECKGFGRILKIDRDLCVPDPRKSIKQKAIQCWAGDSASALHSKLIKFCQAQKIPIDKPWKDLPAAARDEIFNHKSKNFRGVFDWFKKLERKAYKTHVRIFLARYRKPIVCPTCNGSRLRPSALAYRVDSRTLADIQQLPIEKLYEWLTSLRTKLESDKRLSRELNYVFDSLIARLKCLIDLGLPYLTLDRQARTLSGGETQRVNLATAIGSEIVSTQFVLDEPSVGLHSRDTNRLIETLKELQERQNSLLVVEHDLECIESADHIVEIGPLAGEKGGQIVFNGAAVDWPAISVDRVLLASGKKKVDKKNSLKIANAGFRNLKNISLDIPLEGFVALTGVSGSGKSSLVSGVLRSGFKAFKQDEATSCEIRGFERIDNLLIVDQSPLSKTPRANIATFTKIWDEVRTLLASLDDAKLRAVSRSSFSFNVEGGRCPACKGAGYITEDMQFLSDVYVVCEVCLGRRFQEKILEIKYKGNNAFDFLQMTVERCLEIFEGSSRIKEACELLIKVGLGHLTLGHPLSELSGGEAQRLKLIPVLQQAGESKSLLIFDEPTTGLHLRDIEKLISLFRFLRDAGHSVLAVEHNLAFIAASDWVIDLGPEGGERGGEIVAQGTVDEIVKEGSSYTAKALKEFKSTKSTKKKKAKPQIIAPQKELRIFGAKEHNLKSLDISVPLDRVVAITGVSGSGKSSIAKDIIYAEGQRRFLDCLSPYARQFIKELKRPNIEHIENVMPTICVYQHTFQPSRLSTVATMSEVYNLLRLLYSKIGMQFCPDHPQAQITPLTPAEIAEHIKSLKVSGLRVLAPIIKMKKGQHNEVLRRAMEGEISEVRVDGLFASPGKFIDQLDKRKTHSIDFIVGRFNPQNIDLEQITDCVKQALSLAAGTLLVHYGDKEEVFSLERTCPVCHRGFFKPDPEDLSFNSRRGVCTACEGSGLAKTGKPCSVCDGTRLNALGSNIRLNGKNIHEACLLTAPELRLFLSGLNLDKRQRGISEAIFSEMFGKLDTLINIGLDYLVLDRDCTTLSSGELQRLRLATAMGSPLSGVMYIFDEPSAGLHPLDNSKVIGRLEQLKNQGNSVLVIEHDLNNILASDYIIDIGPGGGSRGGEIVYQGDTKNFLESAESETAQAARECIRRSRIIFEKAGSGNGHLKPLLRIEKGRKNNVNLKDLKLPLNSFVTIAGVSGAGKSSLLHNIIADTINLGKKTKSKWQYEESVISSDLDIASVVFIDQKPIGINSRSTPASYLGIWDEVRKVFAQTIEAKTRGWKPSHFSYNTGNGRCPDCKGQGQIKLEMNFLPDASVLCERCGGSRFKDETNSIHYLGKSVSDVLNLTFEEAKPLFANHRKIYNALNLACEIGLGYLTLGQASPTLSGGESQRIKLVSELSSNKKGHTIYILDEPTTGLHKRDVSRLLKILYNFVDRGNSVMVIEHDEDVISHSQHIIELGPGAGENGGRIIFEGSPQELNKSRTPWGSIFKNGSMLDMAAAPRGMQRAI